MQIVLASQSPYRRLQLENFGLKFTAVRPKVDEEALKAEGPRDLAELTRFLAVSKAMSLREDFPAAVILGSDQLVEFQNQRLDKPGTREKAKAQLLKMQGETHHLITSLSVTAADRVLTFTDVTLVKMRRLSEGLVDAYLDLDEPFDCAGSYKFEKAGLGLIESVESADPSAIQGLPLLSLVKGLEGLGLHLNQLWEKKK